MDAMTEEKSIEPVEIYRPVRRMWAGWITLAILFGLLIPTAFVSVLQPSARKDYFLENETFKEAVRMRANFGTQGGWESELRDVVNKVSGDRLTQPAAARLYVSSRYELGKPIQPADLKVLKKSHDAADSAFAQIYEATTLTTQQAENLGQEVTKGQTDFVYKVAAVHALQKSGDKKASDQLKSYWELVATGGIIIGGLLGLVVWALYWVGRTKGRFAPLGHPAAKATVLQADALALRAALMILCFIASDIVLGSLNALRVIHVGDTSAEGITSAFQILSMLAIALMPIGGRVPVSLFGWTAEHFRKNVLWGALAWVGALPLIFLATVSTSIYRSVLPAPVHPIDFTLSSTKNPWIILLTFFIASVAAPVWEETVFRGAFCGSLNKVLGVAGAIVVSSLSFAMLHPQGPAIWFTLASVGVMGCLVDYQRGSIVPSITLHAIHNSVILIITLLIS